MACALLFRMGCMEIKNSGWFPVSLKIMLLAAWLAMLSAGSVRCGDFLRQGTSSQLLPVEGQAEVDGDLFSAIGETGATLNGRVNPHGLATQAYFEYGTTESYGTVQPVTLTSDAGAASESVRTVLIGLAPGTRYHWRLIATNSAGTIATPDATFITLAGPQTPTGLVQQWVRTAQGTATTSHGANGVAIAPDGDAVVVGSLESPVDSSDWFIVKYGLEDGAIRWEQHYNSGSGVLDSAGFIRHAAGRGSLSE